MASPVDANRLGTSISVAATPWTVNLPTGIVAGDLLIYILHGGSGFSPAQTGLTNLFNNANDGGFWRTSVFYRWADGTEAASRSIDVNATSQKGASLIYRITGAANPATQAPESTSVATFTTTANTANPSSISPTGGSKDYLFLIIGCCDGETQTFTHGTYANVTNINSGTGGAVTTNTRLVAGSRQATTATEDPAAFTHAAAQTGGGAWTLAIHPAAVAAAEPKPRMLVRPGVAVLRAGTR